MERSGIGGENENQKNHMVVDYSGTINCFTMLDGYPLHRINVIIKKYLKRYILVQAICKVLIKFQFWKMKGSKPQLKHAEGFTYSVMSLP